MTDSIAVFPPGLRVTNAAGDVVPAGTIEFYAAGTSTPLTVYSNYDLTVALGSTVYLDAGGYPVSGSGSTTKVAVYTGTAAYKIIVKDSSAATLFSADNIKGAIDSAALAASISVTPKTPITTITSVTTLDSDDVGTLINANSTGGTFTVTLPDATGLVDGARLGVRMAGTANQVRVTTTLGQTIARSGATTAALSLTRLGETIWLVNNSGNWVVDTYVPPISSVVGIITIADRLSAPPGSPAAGARYILTSSPSGAWASFAQHDIAEADGLGSWIRYTPPTDCGWIAFVQDENATYQYQDSAWATYPPAASDTAFGTVQNADTAAMESASTTSRVVTPGRQHRHPGHPKAWLQFNGSGTPAIATDYGVSSISDNGTGIFGVNFDTAFSSANYGVSAWARYTTTLAAAALVSATSDAARGTTSLTLGVSASTSAAFIDSSDICAAFFGDL